MFLIDTCRLSRLRTKVKNLQFDLYCTTHYLGPSTMLTWSPEAGSTIQTYTGPLQPGSPPSPPPYRPRKDVNKVFERLKWSVLDPPSQAEIFLLDSEGKPQWMPLLTDPVADEAATILPQSRLRIVIQPLDSWEHWSQTESQPPEPLLIENMDGQPITVRQFMNAVHDYAVPLRRLLCRCCDIYGPDTEARVRFYFQTTMGLKQGISENLCPEMQVYVFEDTPAGEFLVHGVPVDGVPLAEHLKLVEILYRRRLASE
jgi:hypothetical protein